MHLKTYDCWQVLIQFLWYLAIDCQSARWSSCTVRCFMSEKVSILEHRLQTCICQQPQVQAGLHLLFKNENIPFILFSELMELIITLELIELIVDNYHRVDGQIQSGCFFVLNSEYQAFCFVNFSTWTDTTQILTWKVWWCQSSTLTITLFRENE